MHSRSLWILALASSFRILSIRFILLRFSESEPGPWYCSYVCSETDDTSSTMDVSVMAAADSDIVESNVADPNVADSDVADSDVADTDVDDTDES